AVALRNRLDAQRDGALAPYKDRMVLVAGKARFTPDGFQMTERGLTYLDAPDSGDGRVPIESARIAAVRTWQADCAHGDLSSFSSAFAAYAELLETGETDLLPQMPDVAAAARAAAAADTRIPNRPSRAPSSSQPPASESDVVAAPGARPRAGRTASGTALSMSVIHGDLMFVRQPLLLGHYRSLRLTGTESVVDGLLGRAMSTSLAVGNYPDRPGTHEVFLNRSVYRDNPLQLPRPQAAIVVGLGAESTITANELVDSVRQGVAAWSRRLTEMREGAPAVFELASTLLGSGGVRITVGESARLIAQGVREANARLADAGLPVVGHLHLIELYLDRAGDVWRALQVQVAAAPADYELREPVKSSIGGLPRLLDSGYRGAAYDFVSAVTMQGPQGETKIAYTLDTKRARSEVQAQQTQVALVRNLLAVASPDDTVDTEIGRTLFRLLVPIEMEPFLSGTMDMQLEVDDGTAGIPWELLDNGAPTGPGARPWAIRAKLIRKFRTSDYRPRVVDADAEASVLVIGEPAVDLRVYPALPGARREAAAVAQCLASAARRPQRVTELFRRDPQEPGFDANTIVKTLLGRDWRIVHIAGHGEPPLSSAKPRGVVLSDGTFLGPDEITRMRVVPELVFVNCCYLAARDPTQLLAREGAATARSDRARFAATVAESLIRIGVRCVIAAGWPVNDDAARAFATRFYEALLRGERFIDAVAEARGVAFDMGGNTWAAYQCYGDADWRFVPGAADAQAPATSPAEEFAGVAAAKTLVLALETLAIRSKFQKAPREPQQAKIRYLEATYGARWGGIGEVAEAFGRAWSEAGEQDAAARWYTQALNAGDGTASMRVIEQLGNLRARRAVGKLERELAKPKASGAKTRAAAGNRAREEIDAALELLERVTDLQPTVERQSLCGSAWKRLAMVEMQAGDAEAAQRAIAKMKERYRRAVEIARATGSDDLFYPALNFMAAALVADAGKRGFRGFDPALRAEVKAALEAKARDDPDFWSVAGLTELATYDAVVKTELAGALEGILRDHADLHARVSAAWMWSSVLDQARFAFSGYAERAPAAERKAVQALVRQLRGYASAPATDTAT
ncbi:MAG TPA: CHAT domain-containing protein, partial [Casimicrobiaceae bacterium]|nr:CHAT domain-containing protein [Casimicrobiaceae bacterium]